MMRSSATKQFKRLVKAICKADEEQAHMPDDRFQLLYDALEASSEPEFI